MWMMRVLSPLGKRKRALSNIVAYVLLIAITVSLSVLVYSWLRFYVSEDDIESCSEGVNVIIRSYQCFLPDVTGNGGRIMVTLKNKGLFTVDGYELRVHDRADASFGFYLFDDVGMQIEPGKEYTKTYWFNATEFLTLNPGESELTDVKFVEVQPFMNMGGEVRCKSYASQEVICQ
jgi:flagellin-like protein